MAKDQIVFHPIGVIHSPFQDPVGVPIQPRAAAGIKGKIELDPTYKDGLQDLEGFSHLILIYEFHKAGEGDLLVEPFLDDQFHGVFATRAPQRPNKIGLSVVKLISITDTTLEVENLDILDGTPLLDIKPYVPDFDGVGDVRVGWLENKLDQIPGKLADDRFNA
jgi:tRNA-Thr(GGU) m(6)t(6)A37 methyltransferase TsaA